MSGEKTIATLVGKLRFDADYRPLATFEKKLDAVADKLASLKIKASKKITARVGLDTKGLASKAKLASQTSIVLKNVGIDEAAYARIKAGIAKIGDKPLVLHVKLDAKSLAAAVKHAKETQIDLKRVKLDETVLPKIRTKIEGLSRTEICLKNVKFDKTVLPLLQAKLSKLGSTRIRVVHIEATPAALAAAEKRIEDKLSLARISIKDVKIDLRALRAQKTLMRNLLESTTIDLPVDVKLRAADKTLRDWRKKTAEKFKLYIEADISKHKLLRNIRRSLDYVMGKIGVIRLITPKITLTVDRVALKIEIAEVLKEIEREAKIRIKLTGDVSGDRGGRGDGGGPGRRGAFGGGLAGAAMAGGRGFVPGLGGAFAIAQLNKINQELQGQRMAMASVAGGKEEGAVQQKWVKDLANEIGMDYRAVTPAYTKMLASGKTSGMATEEVQGIFQGVSEYGRVMGLDSESMKGSMKAIEQMINKGQVMSEELKGQLAERMPGVVSAMAEAAGFGTGDDAVAKLFAAMEEGSVKSRDVMGEFADILARRVEDTLEEAKKSTAAEQQRFLGQFADSVLVFAEGGFDRALAQFFRLSSESMREADPLIRALGGAFEILLKPLNATIRLVGKFGEALPGIADRLDMTEDGLISLGIAALANLTPLGRMITLFSGLVLAIEDVLVFLDGGESVFGKWFEALSPEKQATMEAFGNSMVNLAASVATVAGMVWEGWSGIFGYFEDSGAGWSVVKTVTSLAEALTKLVDVLVRMRDGDFSDLIPDGNTAAKLGNSFNNIVDTILPGTPLASATRALQSQTPAAQNQRLQEEQAARRQQFEHRRGSGADVPPTVQHIKVDFHVEGNDPNMIATFVQEKIEGIFRGTKTNLVQVTDK